jgi:succinoglycan biosynthesis protein ExoM
MSKPLIVVGIATCRRPKMLARCLASLAAQRGVEGFDVTVVVASNGIDAKHTEAAVVADRYGAVFLCDPVQSIARARNAVLDAAIRLKADWVAFVDDDAVADPDWLASLMYPDYLDTPVLMGVNLYVYPEPRPFWAPADDEPKGYEGQRCKTAYTGNVRFSAALLHTGLRFNEGLGLMGGEDNEFFAAAHAHGFEIRRTLRAITREAAHPERLTYRALVYRSYWCAASELRRLMLTRGLAGAALRKAHTIPLNVVFGACWMLAALAVAPVSRNAFKRLAIEAGLKLAKGAGRAVALVGGLPQPYRVIHGE